MLNCWRLRGILAASVYGENGAKEQRRLDAHLEVCPRCRARQSAFVSLTGALQTPAAELGRDLAPAILRTVAESRKERGRRIQRVGFVWSGIAVAATAILVSVLPYLRVSDESVPIPARTAVVAFSPVEQAMGQAAEMADKHDFATAYRLLNEAVAAHPEDAAAAEAKSRGADIAFSELHWYAEAHHDYEQLAKQFPARFREDPDAITRRDVLAEAQAQDYAPLYALDAAHRHATDTFAQLEQVVGHYPGTFVASLAARDMAALATEGQAARDQVQGFVAARERCQDPAARAQLSMELGHVYLRDLKDPLKATEQYRAAASSPNTVVAKLATECLSRLNAGQ